MAAWATDIDEFRALGHGAITLFNAAVLLAILAVILSANSATPTLLQQAFAFLSWLVQQVVSPLTGGQAVALTATLAPAAAVSAAATGASSSTPAAAANAAATVLQGGIPTMLITPSSS